MSCPDWRALCAKRESHPGEVPGWHAAIEHLDGCPDCRGDALAVDPMLLFRRLPALEVRPGEVEAMKQAVAGMRRAEKTARRAPRKAAPRRVLLRAAAVAAVLLGSVLLRGAGSPPAQSPEPPAAEAADAVALDLHSMPLVEPIDPAYGSLIQVDHEDISLVVVMAPGSDVDV